MSFVFAPAHRDNEPIRLGIAGPSRSGKSYSALRVALGMVGGDPKKVFAINTERGGITLYADKFGFMCAEFRPPYSPARYLEALRAAEKAGAGCIIVDQFSYEHDGDGGILDMHEAELTRMAGTDFGKRERMKFTAWIAPKAAHNELVSGIMQLNCHSIFCLRAREKLKLVRQQNGKIEPMPQGYQPVTGSDFEYELTSLIMLAEGSKGIPDLDAQATGFREPLNTMVKHGQSLDEELGRKLAAWASGKASEQKPSGSSPAGTPAANATSAARSDQPPPTSSSGPKNGKSGNSDSGDADPSPKWLVVAADGKTYDLKSRESWSAKLLDVIAKSTDASALNATRARNGSVFANLHMAGEAEIVTRIEAAIVARVEELGVPFDE
jgi:hypothetical protein